MVPVPSEDTKKSFATITVERKRKLCAIIHMHTFCKLDFV